MRECKHLWKQVILVEILKVVDLVEWAEVIRCSVLDLGQNPLILDEACPVLCEVVLFGLIKWWLVLDFIKVLLIFKRDSGLLHEKVGGYLWGDAIVLQKVHTSFVSEPIENLVLLLGLVVRFTHTDTFAHHNVFCLKDARVYAFNGLICVILALLDVTAAAHQYVIALARHERVFILGKILVLMHRPKAVKTVSWAWVLHFLGVLLVLISLHEL